MITTRYAALDDLSFLLVELEKFAKFLDNENSVWCEDTEYTRTLVSGFIEKHVVIMAESDGQKIGFIIGLATNHWFNPKLSHLGELAWWVVEEHRKTRAGLTLLNEFVKHGEENFDWITCSLEAKSPVNNDCLLKRGFKLLETTYLKETR